MSSRAMTVLAVAVLIAVTTAAHAGPDRYQKCDKGRYAATANYGACQQHLLASYFGGYTNGKFDHEKFQAALSKCRVKYTGTWATLKGKPTDQPSACDGPRFLDNGNGTVTDQLTGLQWERKTDDGGVHDKDNRYAWSADPNEGEPSDGTVFTTFLATLNDDAGCFAGRCDWRLPTIYELQTILVEPAACTASPCIDQAVFGPTGAGGGPLDNTLLYWSGTSQIDLLQDAWVLYFGLVDDIGINYVTQLPKNAFGSARAVRAGW